MAEKRMKFMNILNYVSKKFANLHHTHQIIKFLKMEFFTNLLRDFQKKKIICGSLFHAILHFNNQLTTN